MPTTLRVAGCLALLSLTACGRSDSGKQAAGKPPDADRAVAKSVIVCKTTESELRRQLGNPTRDGRFHGDRVVSWITPETNPSRYLAVLLDTSNVVVDLYWDVPTSVPWVPTSQCAAGQTHPAAGG